MSNIIQKAASRSLLLLILSSSTEAFENNQSDTLQWHPWSTDIFQQAKNLNKLVLVDLTASWCNYCEKMKKTTYRDVDVINTIQNSYIAIRADEATYPDLKARYQKDGRPTTIIFDHNGNEIFKHSGYLKPEWLNWTLTAIAENPDAQKQTK